LVLMRYTMRRIETRKERAVSGVCVCFFCIRACVHASARFGSCFGLFACVRVFFVCCEGLLLCTLDLHRPWLSRPLPLPLPGNGKTLESAFAACPHVGHSNLRCDYAHIRPVLGSWFERPLEKWFTRTLQVQVLSFTRAVLPNYPQLKLESRFAFFQSA
jgi:hypothetical protein